MGAGGGGGKGASHLRLLFCKIVYFIDNFEFIILVKGSSAEQIKCFEFGSIKRVLRPRLRTIIAG